MAYAWGPLNHAALDSVARMVEVLRSPIGGSSAAEKRTGLVTNISGMFGKHACALFSNHPNERGFGFEDVTDKVAQQELPIPLDENYQGLATIVGYTVSYNKGELSHAVAYCDTPAGLRTVVRSDDKILAQAMTETEFVGREVLVQPNGVFSALA